MCCQIFICKTDYIVENYSELDYIDFTIQYIKKWLKKNNIVLKRNVPLSWVDMKYGEEIRNSLGIWKGSNIRQVGRSALEQGMFKGPTMRPKTKFTTKNKKLLDRVVKMTVPPFASIKFTEEVPYEVKVEINIDRKNLLKNGNSDSLYQINEWHRKFKEFLSKYASLNTQGNPLYGQVRMSFYSDDVFPESEFGKGTQFQKDVKKFFKENYKNLLRVGIEDATREIRIKPVYSGGWSGSPRHDQKLEFENKFNKFIEDMGYNPSFFAIIY